MQPPYTFFYDHDCGFCVRCKTLAHVLDWRRRVRFVPLAGPEADERLGFMDVVERYASSHLAHPDGRVESAGAGVLGLAALLPLTAPLVWLYRLLPGHRVVLERLYRIVADHRHQILPGSTCGLERPEGL